MAPVESRLRFFNTQAHLKRVPRTCFCQWNIHLATEKTKGKVFIGLQRGHQSIKVHSGRNRLAISTLNLLPKGNSRRTSVIPFPRETISELLCFLNPSKVIWRFLREQFCVQHKMACVLFGQPWGARKVRLGSLPFRTFLCSLRFLPWLS